MSKQLPASSLMFFLFTLAVLASLPGPARSSDTVERSNWPRFRGPTGVGTTPEGRLPTRWNQEEGVNWRLDVPGESSASPIVWEDYVFITAARNGNGMPGRDRYLIGIDRRKGSVLWEVLVADDDPGVTHKDHSYASSTPATDGERVVSFFGTGGLACHDFTGKLLWKRDGLGKFLSIWGSAASPILVDDLCVVVCDQDAALEMEPDPSLPSQSYILAVDKVTGDVRWNTRRFGSRGFSTPVVHSRPDGTTELVVNGPDGVYGYDPKTGNEIWKCLRETRFGEPTPVFGEGLILAYGGRPGLLLAIREGGVGDVSTSGVAWSVERRQRDVSSPVIAGTDLINFGRDGVGACHDVRTGVERWKGRLKGSTYASGVLTADGLIYFLTREGWTQVIKAQAPQLAFVYENPLGEGGSEDFSSSMAVSNGQIFIRSNRALYCIGEVR
jgi:hypothetical protein